MSDPLKNIPQDILAEITRLVSVGKKIDAIKRYREAAGCDLKTGKEVVDSLFGDTRYTPPSSPVYPNGSDDIFTLNAPHSNFQTKDPLQGIPQNVRQEITGLIYSSNKIAAIKCYRAAAHCDLYTAKQAVEAFTDHLKNTNPTLFQGGPQKDGLGMTVFFALVIIGVVAAKNLPDNFMDEWQGKLDTLMQNVRQPLSDTTVESEEAKPPMIAVQIVPKEQPLLDVQRDPIDHETLYQPLLPENGSSELTTLYRNKLANPEYVAWKSQPGLPKGYQDFIEEHQIKYKRAEIARNLVLPAGVGALAIPVITDRAINIDGDIQQNEWLKAALIKLEPESTGSTLYLQADKDWLYLAADVPGDTTQEGFDQFRFYIHVDIDPAIRNERIHVGRNGSEALGGIRETRINWQGEPPANEDERWKKYPISDWRIYRLAKGASSVKHHRQFEAKLNLKESGLTIGAPFPVFVEIETDPFDDGRTRQRRYLGGLGNQNQPVWLIMQ